MAYLLHLHSVDKNVVFLIVVIVVEQPAIEHDGIMLLSDLIGLWQVAEGVVLSVKLNLRQDSTTQS